MYTKGIKKNSKQTLIYKIYNLRTYTIIYYIYILLYDRISISSGYSLIGDGNREIDIKNIII